MASQSGLRRRSRATIVDVARRAGVSTATVSRVINQTANVTPETVAQVQAAIEALNALKRPCQIEFHTDSEYLRKGITEWIRNWKRRGWKTAAKKPVKNQDLWQALDLSPTTAIWISPVLL